MTPRDKQMLTRLQNLAAPKGVTVELKADGHFHLQGALLVNYYPFSAKRTAYVANTVKGSQHVDMKQAIKMACEMPPITKVKRKSYKAIKLKMLRKRTTCHWCQCQLTEETATVDHVIPLSRGGLDNANNRVLACEPCNNGRGNSMPEVRAGT